MVADRADYHPGEPMRLRAEARNAGNARLWAPTGSVLHVLMPGGEHWVYLYSATNRANLYPGSTVSRGWWEFRFVRAAGGWRPAGDAAAKETPLDLSRPGIYTFWDEHDVQAGWLASMDQAAAATLPASTSGIATGIGAGPRPANRPGPAGSSVHG